MARTDMDWNVKTLGQELQLTIVHYNLFSRKRHPKNWYEHKQGKEKES